MTDDRVWWMDHRFQGIASVLFANGYAPAPDPRDPNEWDEKHQEDPPTGLVRIKSVRLADPGAEDSDFDDEITFTVTEFWSATHVSGAQSERGFYLISYSYHAHWYGIDQRWDFDPDGHPEMPYHFHPPGQAGRTPMAQPISPEDAIDAFEAWIETEHRPSTRHG